jgi:hypothetical protein
MHPSEMTSLMISDIQASNVRFSSELMSGL